MTDVSDPTAVPASATVTANAVAAPRLARHTFTLADGHRIGLAVSGRGVPLVVVHGFTAEGFLYAQTLHRLVRKGFKVIAIEEPFSFTMEGCPIKIIGAFDLVEEDESGAIVIVGARHGPGYKTCTPVRYGVGVSLPGTRP